MPVDFAPRTKSCCSSGSGEQPYAKPLGFPTLTVLAFDSTALRGYFFLKGPREICPVHHPTNHENLGSCPKIAICQDLKGIGNVLIHPSSVFIYRNSGSKTGGAWPIAYNWTVTKHQPLHKSPVSQVSSGSAQLYHPDSHSLSTQEPSAQIHGTQSTTEQSCAWSRHH